MQQDSRKKSKILLADDSEMNREILKDMLGDEYDLMEAADGVQAIELMQKHQPEISLLLLDLNMPKLDGFAVLDFIKSRNWNDVLPVVMISAEDNPEILKHAYDLGVTDYISRPFNHEVVLRRVRNTIKLYDKQKTLASIAMDQMVEREKSTNLMVNILSHVVEFRNGESGLHVLHIHVLTELLLTALLQKTDRYSISADDVPLIALASALHDIGKITIPDEILNKPGRFTPEEFAVMKTHSANGADLLENLPYGEDKLLSWARKICRWHHERWDGRGYPDGLKGDEIPIEAQVVALADVYDALTSKRVYKPAFSHEKALEMILNNECGVFNPLLMECLQENADKLKFDLAASDLSTDATYRISGSVSDFIRKNTKNQEAAEALQPSRMMYETRQKYEFFSAVSRDIEFEYTEKPPLLKLSPWTAQYLNLPQNILDPLNDNALNAAMGDGEVQKIFELVASCKPEDSSVLCRTCILRPNGTEQKYEFFIKIIWSEDECPQRLAVVGKALPSENRNQ